METRSLLPRVWEVPQVFRNRLGAAVGRQRAMFADGHLLLVLHAPAGPDETERAGRFIWRKPDGTWTSSDLGAGVNAVNKHLDQYSEAIQECDELEERASWAEDYFAVVERLSPIQRSVRHLHQVMQEARHMCPGDRDIINFRDRAYDLERRADLLQAETKNSLDLLIARRAEEQARSSRRMALAAHRLNMLAAFFFPLATLSAVLSVNLQHGMEHLPGPVPFFTFLFSGLLAGILLMRFVSARGE